MIESGAVQLGSFVFSERHHVQWRRQDSLDPRHALFVPLLSEAEERGFKGGGPKTGGVVEEYDVAGNVVHSITSSQQGLLACLSQPPVLAQAGSGNL